MIWYVGQLPMVICASICFYSITKWLYWEVEWSNFSVATPPSKFSLLFKLLTGREKRHIVDIPKKMWLRSRTNLLLLAPPTFFLLFFLLAGKKKRNIVEIPSKMKLNFWSNLKYLVSFWQLWQKFCASIPYLISSFLPYVLC